MAPEGIWAGKGGTEPAPKKQPTSLTLLTVISSGRCGFSFCPPILHDGRRGGDKLGISTTEREDAGDLGRIRWVIGEDLVGQVSVVVMRV